MPAPLPADVLKWKSYVMIKLIWSCNCRSLLVTHDQRAAPATAERRGEAFVSRCASQPSHVPGEYASPKWNTYKLSHRKKTHADNDFGLNFYLARCFGGKQICFLIFHQKLVTQDRHENAAFCLNTMPRLLSFVAGKSFDLTWGKQNAAGTHFCNYLCIFLSREHTNLMSSIEALNCRDPTVELSSESIPTSSKTTLSKT